MKITYINHSGFLIEWDTCYWLFDYYKGNIPDLDTEKKIFVFASHNHGDHYNPDIFKLCNKYKDIVYILSSDIKLKKTDILNEVNSPDRSDSILSVKPNNQYELYDKNNNTIVLKTLKSTDSGVAFLLHYQGKTIYHAGDLNLWMWKGETKQYNNNMKAMFLKEMNYLKDIPIDIAFVPLDPRQEEYYDMGLNSLLETAKVRYVFPMHFWEKPSVIKQFKEKWPVNTNHTQIMDVSTDGQEWQIE
ncbi:MBL fold metallo-hydrolase [Mobilitalea sibirica]|uniref:MBL fold metallo-hydrolase n=1 Tax=Mobilitalea sibirica TaxID=1462919 RepID=A0A8J7GYS8_9FIRM|nr:MBL fold metallo-hydrolase [Mobilitalea sibirica]MBH1940779.1 MBL fold metallo-hydrolase [Mobilitalea sibirica]